MIILAISGKKQSGKDTVVDIIRRVCLLPVARVGFADELKVQVAEATGKSIDFIEKNKSQFRTILQWWGTDFRRFYDGDDYWVRKVIKVIDTYKATPTIVCVPDCRFLSEIKALKELGCKSIRIDRRICNRSNDTHPSETELDNYKEFDWVVNNDGSLSDLEHMVRSSLSFLKIPTK
jgi:phosphomevalonate kinase